jgi:hypothetical protein
MNRKTYENEVPLWLLWNWLTLYQQEGLEWKGNAND